MRIVRLKYSFEDFGVGTFPSYRKKLQILQNKAVRIISNSSIYNSITTLYHKFQILNTGMSDLYFIEVAKLMH